MEPSWDVIKGTIQWLIYPLLTGLVYFCKDYFGRVKTLETDLILMKSEMFGEIASLKVRMAVQEAMILEIKDDIKEIKVGVTKLVDRVHG